LSKAIIQAFYINIGIFIASLLNNATNKKRKKFGNNNFAFLKDSDRKVYNLNPEYPLNPVKEYKIR